MSALSSTSYGFSELLKQENQPTWNQAVEHRFVKELFRGTVPDKVMAGYLIQDHRFQDGFLTLLGAAIATADNAEARLTFGRFAGDVAGDEATYFIRCFEELGIDDDLRDAVPDTPATTGFKAIFAEAAEARSYAAALGVLAVCEGLYFDWATGTDLPWPQEFRYAEWIRLHDYPGFHTLVAFLRSELDRVGPEEPEVARDFFARTTQLELDFFEQSYSLPIELKEDRQ